MQLNKEIATKVLSVVDAGLVNGVGVPEPGKMCVEAAVCFALGLPHSDSPPCVGAAVRSFKIALNDSAWSSDEARTKGMRKLAIAQLGSNEIDQAAFVKELALATIRRIVPLALRAAAGMNAPYKDDLEQHAKACEDAKDLDAARAASYAASAASDAAIDAASYAASAARAASDAAIDAASYAASAARAAIDAIDARYARDEVLTLMADIGLDALKKCGSPGCQWLDLCQ